jgi:hypothetical protein
MARPGVLARGRGAPPLPTVSAPGAFAVAPCELALGAAVVRAPAPAPPCARRCSVWRGPRPWRPAPPRRVPLPFPAMARPRRGCSPAWRARPRAACPGHGAVRPRRGTLARAHPVIPGALAVARRARPGATRVRLGHSVPGLAPAPVHAARGGLALAPWHATVPHRGVPPPCPRRACSGSAPFCTVCPLPMAGAASCPARRDPGALGLAPARPWRGGTVRPPPQRGSLRARPWHAAPCPGAAWPLRSTAPARCGLGSRGRGAPAWRAPLPVAKPRHAACSPGATRSAPPHMRLPPRRARLFLATHLPPPPPPCTLCALVTLFILMKWKLNSEIDYVSYFT